MKIDIRKFDYRFTLEVRFRPLATSLGGKNRQPVNKWTKEQKLTFSNYMKEDWQRRKANQ